LLKYLDYLRDALKDTLSQLRRSLLFSFLTILAFALIQTHTLEKFSLGSIEVKQGSVLVALLPLVAAYFFLEVAMKERSATDRARLVNRCYALWNPEFDSQDLDVMSLPDQPIYFSVASRVSHLRTQQDRRTSTVMISLRVTMIILPTIFEAYAWTSLISSRGWHDWLVWVNLVIGGILSLAYWWILVAEGED
jgi:hypothetical protein